MGRPRSGSVELTRAAGRALRRHRSRAGVGQCRGAHFDHAVAPKRWKKMTVHGVRANPPAAVVSEAASMGGTMSPRAGRRRPPLLVMATWVATVHATCGTPEAGTVQERLPPPGPSCPAPLVRTARSRRPACAARAYSTPGGSGACACQHGGPRPRASCSRWRGPPG